MVLNCSDIHFFTASAVNHFRSMFKRIRFRSIERFQKLKVYKVVICQTQTNQLASRSASRLVRQALFEYEQCWLVTISTDAMILQTFYSPLMLPVELDSNSVIQNSS